MSELAHIAGPIATYGPYCTTSVQIPASAVTENTENTKAAGKEACNDIRDLIQTDLINTQNTETATLCHSNRMIGKAGRNMKNSTLVYKSATLWLKAKIRSQKS